MSVRLIVSFCFVGFVGGDGWIGGGGGGREGAGEGGSEGTKPQQLTISVLFFFNIDGG